MFVFRETALFYKLFIESGVHSSGLQLTKRLWRIGYCQKKWTQKHEFKFWTKLFMFDIALISMGEAWINLFFFLLLRSPQL